MQSSTDNHIDAVILWVDGNDPKHQEKMLPFLKDKSTFKNSKFKARYSQIDEIRFTVNSLLKFAPYLRTIFIVTDNQSPSFLEESKDLDIYKNVIVIDHKVIFKGHEEVLPTFCSRSIETCIHRIPNLAEKFIYLNDDFFLINKTEPSDFFKNGLPVLRGKWLKFDEDIFYKRFKKVRKGHKFAQQRAAKLIGHSKYYNFRHTPHPLRKSTLASFFEENKALFLENIRYQFRSENQFLTQGLANHIEIKNSSCYLESDLRLIYFRSYKKPLLWYTLKFKFLAPKKLFLGMQSLNLAPNKILSFLLNWLQKRVS